MAVCVVLALLLPLLAWGQGTSPRNQGPPPKTAVPTANKTLPPVSPASTQSVPLSAPVITARMRIELSLTRQHWGKSITFAPESN